jgi:hypothetical protein
MATKTGTANHPQTRASTGHTFANGVTVPFRIISPPMPDPLQLIAGSDAHTQVVACVPDGRSAPIGRHERFRAYVRELVCVHWSAAEILTGKEDSLILACPQCRRRGVLVLRAPELGTPEQERAARQYETPPPAPEF